MNIHFEKAGLQHQKILFEWLEEPHVKEFWDNSQAHKDDILTFMNGREKPSSYFGGIYSYWIGSLTGVPYCLVMTHEESESSHPPECYKPYLARDGKTFGLDFCIGNKNHLGKGLAAQTLTAFMDYFSEEIEPKVSTFLIDPFTNNPRAIHVYQKAGFQIQCEFRQEGGYFDQHKGVVMVKANSVKR